MRFFIVPGSKEVLSNRESISRVPNFPYSELKTLWKTALAVIGTLAVVAAVDMLVAVRVVFVFGKSGQLNLKSGEKACRRAVR